MAGHFTSSEDSSAEERELGEAGHICDLPRPDEGGVPRRGPRADANVVLDVLLEPTIPVVAPLRGDGYDHAGTDYALISLTHLWDWTGFPVAALPSGVGAQTGLPVGVSLIGPAGTDRRLLTLGIALQAELGVPEPPGL